MLTESLWPGQGREEELPGRCFLHHKQQANAHKAFPWEDFYNSWGRGESSQIKVYQQRVFSEERIHTALGR